MGALLSSQTKEIKRDTLDISDKSLREQILRSDRYIKNRPWIFELEKEIMNHTQQIFNTNNDHVQWIFDTLSSSSLRTFCVFDIPFQSHFHQSPYPVDLIVGLYSIHDVVVSIQLFVSDIFLGKYTLIPSTPCMLNRFVLRFLFYGYENHHMMFHIKYLNEMQSSGDNGIHLICCALDNIVRKDCVLHSLDII